VDIYNIVTISKDGNNTTVIIITRR